MVYNVDSANPEDDARVSDYPANERASRLAIEDSLGVEHTVATGLHKLQRGTTTARDLAITAPVAGNLWLNTTLVPERPQWYSGAAWKNVEEFVSGTKMVFYQSSAPSGWTRDASNDKVIRVVSTGGGDTGGSWTISGVTVDSHVISSAEMPAHTHTVSGTVSAGSAHSHTGTSDSGGAHTPSGSIANESAHTHTGTTSSDGAHTHGLPRNAGPVNGINAMDVSNQPNAGYTTFTTDSNGAHTHSFTSSAGSAHNHTFTGDAVSAHTHTFTTATEAAHTHTYSSTSGSTGSGGGHVHTLTSDAVWRPAYVNCLIATKD